MDSPEQPGGGLARQTVLIFIGMAGLAAALTILFLSMRSVMKIGGTCASGNTPYVISHPCPKGVSGLLVGSIWGGLIFAGLYAWQSSAAGAPALVALAWPALFLSLGYNFLDFGIHPPDDSGLVWGWLICGALFLVMGGAPLVLYLFFGRGERSRILPRGTGPFLRMGAGIASTASHWTPSTIWGAPAPTVPSRGDFVSRLERLAELHRAGDLTDDQYQSAKEQIIRETRS